MVRKKNTTVSDEYFIIPLWSDRLLLGAIRNTHRRNRGKIVLHILLMLLGHLQNPKWMYQKSHGQANDCRLIVRLRPLYLPNPGRRSIVDITYEWRRGPFRRAKVMV